MCADKGRRTVFVINVWVQIHEFYIFTFAFKAFGGLLSFRVTSIYLITRYTSEQFRVKVLLKGRPATMEEVG